MLFGVTELFSGLPFALSFASAGTAAVVVGQRRRGALNEALHELRRPMQALALALPREAAEAPAVDSSLLLAITAMERLDCEINGEQAVAAAEAIQLRRLVESAKGRWAGAAQAAGVGLRVDWTAGEVTVQGEPARLAQALDNLIINGIEHGRGDLTIRGHRSGGVVRLAVHDEGGSTRRPGGADLRPVVTARRRDRRRRGHGLRVVRRTAADHGGGFKLMRSGSDTEAVLELPLSAAPGLHG